MSSATRSNNIIGVGQASREPHGLLSLCPHIVQRIAVTYDRFAKSHSEGWGRNFGAGRVHDTHTMARVRGSQLSHVVTSVRPRRADGNHRARRRKSPDRDERR